MKKDNPTETLLISEGGVVLQPGKIYLGSTVEHVATDRYVTFLEGKSSLGRLGFSAHITAGYIDCGFRGTITLEITVVQPLRIYPGIRVAQLCYSTLEGEILLYRGKYQCQSGAQPSRSWLDFLGDQG